jgi:hypothetical protein
LPATTITVTVFSPAASALASLVRSSLPSLSLPLTFATLSGLTVCGAAEAGAAAARPPVRSALAARIASEVGPGPLCLRYDKTDPYRVRRWSPTGAVTEDVTDVTRMGAHM